MRILPYRTNRTDISDFMNDFFETSFSRVAQSTFKIDVEAKENEYLVSADLPGVSKENINIEVEDGNLTIAVSEIKESEDQNEEKTYLHRERSQRSMSRSVYLGEIDEDAIKASLKDGVLEITLPKKAEIETKKTIAID